MERFEREVVDARGLRLGTHRMGGCAFLAGDFEVAHLHGNGLLDAWTGREKAAALIAERAAEPHHVLGRGGWVSFWIEAPEDVPGALRLIAAALDAAADARL